MFIKLTSVYLTFLVFVVTELITPCPADHLSCIEGMTSLIWWSLLHKFFFQKFLVRECSEIVNSLVQKYDESLTKELNMFK